MGDNSGNWDEAPPVKMKRPPGRAPSGQMWDEYLGWVPDPNFKGKGKAKATGKGKKRKADNASDVAPAKRSRPVGRPPKGKVWDEQRGEYIPDPDL